MRHQQGASAGLEPASTLKPGERAAQAQAYPKTKEQILVVDGVPHPVLGLPVRKKGILRWIGLLGPGLIATSAGNDAGGIATYSSAGAQYGYDLIWVMVFITFSLAVVQEMCARLGAATGRGMLDLIRDRFGLSWAALAITLVLAANGGLVVTEFVGLGAAAELLGVSKVMAIPLAAALLWYLVIHAGYARVEKILLMMTLVFFAYPIAAVMAHPDGAALLHGALVPKMINDENYLVLFVALVGTTVTPYMQLYQQSSLAEKGVARRHYGPEKADAYLGALFSNLMAIAMMVATAATLHKTGVTRIDTADQAAKALEPVVGHLAKELFAIGLLGATLLAGTVLPLATAYAISEAFGFPKGVNLDYRRAPVFFRIFTGLLFVGALLALVPGIPVMQLLIGVQVLNGVLLPVILVFILVLINNVKLMGNLKNGPVNNFLAWTTFVIITLAVAVMLTSQFLGLFGIHILGSK